MIFISREGKVVLEKLIRYKTNLEEIMEYYQNPLPAICSQAVHVVCWFYLALGAVASYPWCHGEDYGYVWYYVQV